MALWVCLPTTSQGFPGLTGFCLRCCVRELPMFTTAQDRPFDSLVLILQAALRMATQKACARQLSQPASVLRCLIIGALSLTGLPGKCSATPKCACDGSYPRLFRMSSAGPLISPGLHHARFQACPPAVAFQAAHRAALCRSLLLTDQGCRHFAGVLQLICILSRR